ncbi:MAG: 2Fe-2S iron-sulfur cluster binding domain-containing protein [Mogibacterium sp.]|nr:2Fe-2S iron-sulfur cluster binding domain-containing protein [Mogibacterium sp.]
MKVKGFLKDVGGASRVTKMRKELIAKGSPIPQPKDPIRELADALHPGKQVFTVTEIRDASPTAKTYRFSPKNGHVPVFQCGQYANFYLTIGESVLTRAYSISSAPYEARLKDPYFEVTIRSNVPYLVPDWFLENVEVGSEITAALPFGQFYYEPLRDSRNVVGIAGGSGITPFASMAKEIAHGKLDIDLTIMYGSVKHTDIVCGDELQKAADACPDKIHLVHVMSDDPEWDGEKGFLTRELIEKYSPEDPSYFFCGPPVMYFMIEKIMKEMNVPLRRFRHDAAAQPGVKLIPGFPMDQVGKKYKITVLRGIHEDVIDAAADEPVAVALERAGIPIDTHCRGGECGYCRSQLLAGDIFVSPISDGRRAMDKEFGWFHACSAYPTSDLKIKIPII